jgi:hypothetical protein
MKQTNRNKFLKDCVRGGVLAGIAGLGAVLVSREKKFECSSPCGECTQFKDGKCSQGIK